MAQFRRRLWGSARPPRKEGTRLYTMVALLFVVLILMMAANRPEIWSRLFPNPDRPAAPDAAGTHLEPAPSEPQARPVPESRDGRSRLLFGTLTVVCIAYFAWRITRIGLAVYRRPQSKRLSHPRTAPPPADDA